MQKEISELLSEIDFYMQSGKWIRAYKLFEILKTKLQQVPTPVPQQ